MAVHPRIGVSMSYPSAIQHLRDAVEHLNDTDQYFVKRTLQQIMLELIAGTPEKHGDGGSQSAELPLLPLDAVEALKQGNLSLAMNIVKQDKNLTPAKAKSLLRGWCFRNGTVFPDEVAITLKAVTSPEPETQNESPKEVTAPSAPRPDRFVLEGGSGTFAMPDEAANLYRRGKVPETHAAIQRILGVDAISAKQLIHQWASV